MWSCDFLNERLENGRRVRLSVVTDEYTHECLALDVARNFRGNEAVGLRRYLFAAQGCPAHIRSDNDPEFASKAVERWPERSGIETLYIARGNLWGNGHVEPFSSKPRAEYLNQNWSLPLADALDEVEA